MASFSEQFLKVSWNSVQRSYSSSGLQMGTDGRTDERTDGHKDHYISLQVCGEYKKRLQITRNRNLYPEGELLWSDKYYHVHMF